MDFQELVSPSLKDLFVKEIEHMILSGKLSIGEKLPTERELATKMRVSRAVINGGITELANKGFLDVIPRKGTFVADYKHKGKLDTLTSILEYNGGYFNPSMLDSIFEVRRSMENHITTLATQNRTPQDVINLKNHIKKLNTITSIQELSIEIFEFYHILAIASGNIIYPLIMYAFRPIYLSLMEVVYRHDIKERRIDILSKLVESIENQDVDGACHYLLDISNSAYDILTKHYESGQSFK